MIKLNNKNITYVALADSNNSLKAPKEIWYADSNNSVKLVYQRKDALIEGEDYEKYHLLRAEMPLNKLLMTLPINSNNVDFYIKRLSLGNITILITNGYKYFFWSNAYQIGSYGNGVDVEHHPYSSDTPLFHIVTNSTNVLINDIQFNSVGFPIRSINFTTEPAGNEGVTLTSTISVDEIERYIPCKLLKPVPKWLDANGIRRQVGECGMIDLVSGKFYGNVNSVGTFTVENYYERKEWLVGDGSAYINTKVKLHFVTDNVYIKGSKNNEATNKARFFGNYSGGENAKSLELIYYTSVQSDTVSKPFVTDGRFGINPSSEFEFYTTPFGSTTSVSIIYNGDTTIFNVNLNEEYLEYEATNDLILLNTNDTRYCMKADVANFKVIRSSTIIRNLIPCTLTMDLPASMDANNIARTKGTSGMWDLVSDRFYGNVANSGTFKAVNLAQGVDYEVHQWLVEDGNAYIEGINYNLWDNTISLQIGKTNVRGNRYFAANYLLITEDMSSSQSYLMVIFRQNSDSTPHIADIGPYSSMPDVVTMDFYIENSLFYCNQNGVVKTNNPAQTAIESTWKSVASRIYSSKMSYIREVLPNGSYNSNLIPVKLLKSIPSKYDANGIARQAGECGMYDTVNDLFYGNVASSGTFSVSDDS